MQIIYKMLVLSIRLPWRKVIYIWRCLSENIIHSISIYEMLAYAGDWMVNKIEVILPLPSLQSKQKLWDRGHMTHIKIYIFLTLSQSYWVIVSGNEIKKSWEILRHTIFDINIQQFTGEFLWSIICIISGSKKWWLSFVHPLFMWQLQWPTWKRMASQKVVKILKTCNLSQKCCIWWLK